MSLKIKEPTGMGPPLMYRVPFEVTCVLVSGTGVRTRFVKTQLSGAK